MRRDERVRVRSRRPSLTEDEHILTHRRRCGWIGQTGDLLMQLKDQKTLEMCLQQDTENGSEGGINLNGSP